MIPIFKNIIINILIITSILFGSCQHTSVAPPLNLYNIDYLDNFYYTNLNPDSTLSATKTLLSSIQNFNFYSKNQKNLSSEELIFLGTANEYVADLYRSINALKPATYLYEQALKYYEKTEYNDAILSTHLKIGRLYHYNRMFDIAIIYYELAEERDSISPNYHWIILENKVSALYESGDYITADSIIDIINDTIKRNTAYDLAYADMYYYHHDFKKALPYLINVYNNGDNQEKLTAAEKLSDIYFQLKDTKNELLYTQFQAKMTSAEIQRTPMKLEMEKIFDDFIRQESLIIQDKSNRINKVLNISLIIAASLIIIVLSYLLLFRKKYREKIIAAEKTINDTHETINSKDKIIDNISQKLISLEKKNEAPSFDECYSKFTESEIYNTIKSSLNGISIFIKTIPDYSNLALTNKEIIQLTQTANECFPNLSLNLKKDFPGLTTSDMKFIFLCLMNYSDVEISVFLGLTYGATNKRNNKIKSVFNTQDEINHFLINYLKNKL